MKVVRGLVVVISLALLSSCSEDSTTGPEDSGGGDHYTLEKSEMIGSAGGTIEVADRTHQGSAFTLRLRAV